MDQDWLFVVASESASNRDVDICARFEPLLLALLIGYDVFAGVSADITAATQATAAGAILAMIADTMIPEAFAEAHEFAGLITVFGFLAAFALSKLAG